MATDSLSPSQLKRKSRKFRAGRYDKSLCNVYGLVGPDGRVRYIGQTRATLKNRLRLHFKASANENSPVCRWIRETPGVDIFLIDGNATWDVSEILYIDRFRREGHDLLNVLRGGRDALAAVKREGR